jgi:DMSO/TMAO reductase YedYZ molybdopterin-dependent catalytic subunit
MSWTPNRVRVLSHSMTSYVAAQAGDNRHVVQSQAPMTGVDEQGSSHDRPDGDELPPGQHQIVRLPATEISPPTPIPPQDWEITLTTEEGKVLRWDWLALSQLPHQAISVDLHSVTGWSVLNSSWHGTSVRHLFRDVPVAAAFAEVSSYADCTSTVPLDDLLEMPTWLACPREGQDPAPKASGALWLLVPHLYLHKSVPWVHRVTLTNQHRPGTWERLGYHHYGDPWQEQRFEDA